MQQHVQSTASVSLRATVLGRRVVGISADDSSNSSSP